MDLNFITEMYVPIIVVLCLIIGYVAKKWVKDIDNKYIPTILCVVGAICAVTTQGLSLETIVAGGVSGLAATGLHQAFTKIIEKEE